MTPTREFDWPAAAVALAAAFPPGRWPARVRTVLESVPAGEPLAVAFSGGADSLAVLLALAGVRDAECGVRSEAESGEQRAENGDRKPEKGDRLALQSLGEGGKPETGNTKTETGERYAVLRTTADGAGPTPVRSPRSEVAPPPSPSVPPCERTARRSVPTIGRLVALHFNHRLRGAAADADAEFCGEVCAALGVRLVVGAADWPTGSDVSEAQAREARFDFFGRAMAEANARTLVLGHHRDDGVETMLLRLSRGSGSRGLAAPRPVQRMADGTVRVRPFLDLAKAEIVAALRAAGVPWCEDETNHGDAYFRNRLRRSVVPAWTAAAPADLAAAVARSRALLEEEDEALEAWVDRVLPAELAGPLPLAALRAAPVAVARRALQRWLGGQDLGDILSRVAFDELLAAIRGEAAETRRSAGPDAFLEFAGDQLAVVPNDLDEPSNWAGGELPVPGMLALPDGAELHATVVPLDPTLRRNVLAGEKDDGVTAFLGFSPTPSSLQVRLWRRGDRYISLGSKHATKLQDQFVNRRIAKGLRSRLPVVVGPTGEIGWVPGLPPAHGARIEDGSSVAVQLTYHPANPLSHSPHGR